MIVLETHIFSFGLQVMLFVTASMLLWVNYVLYLREVEHENRLKRLIDTLYSMSDEERAEKIREIMGIKKR